MKLISLVILFSLLLPSCAIPGFGTITIKNKTAFAVIAEFKMTASDRNKTGRFITKPGDEKNYDFSYKHEPLKQASDHQKQELNFYLSGNFFRYRLAHPLSEITEIRWRGEDLDEQSVIFSDGVFGDLSNEEFGKKLYETDRRLVTHRNNDDSSQLFVHAPNSVNRLEVQVLRVFSQNEEESGEFADAAREDEIFLDSRAGHDVIQKTYICKINRCQPE